MKGSQKGCNKGGKNPQSTREGTPNAEERGEVLTIDRGQITFCRNSTPGLTRERKAQNRGKGSWIRDLTSLNRKKKFLSQKGLKKKERGFPRGHNCGGGPRGRHSSASLEPGRQRVRGGR